jgi:hypothetical protein
MATSLPMRGGTEQWWGSGPEVRGSGSGLRCVGFGGIDDESPAARADAAASLRAATGVAGISLALTESGLLSPASSFFTNCCCWRPPGPNGLEAVVD